MEEQRPTRRRGSSLPADSRTDFDRSASLDPARNPAAKPGADFVQRASTAPASHDEARTPEALPLLADAVGDAPRTIALALRGRGSLLHDLVALIGLDGTARLIAAFGGMRLYIPHAPQPDDTLSRTIGLEAARILAQIYGGDRIDVPNPTPRRIRIIELRANGVSIDVIARSLQCTRRRVFQVLAEARQGRRLRESQQPR